MTAAMLDEGAGERDALGLSSAVNDLGASLHSSAALDGSRVSLFVLKKHIDAGFGLFADVVARPRFEPAEFTRVHELWTAALQRRADDAGQVARLVTRAVMYGADTPYGHPTAGNIDTAKTITLDDVKRFYAQGWRPDAALLIAAGDITKPEVDRLVASRLGAWRRPAGAVPARVPPPSPLSSRPKLVLVDRPDAPQSVVTVARPGVAAGHRDAPVLDLVNTALGGSFTSRLNQNLREDRGWTYGARSAFLETRGVGTFVARASVFTNVTSASVRQITAEIERISARGLSPREHHKVRARDLTDLVESNETVQGLVGRLSSLAMLGLPANFDAQASAARQAATREQLTALAAQHLDARALSVVVVGPRALLGAQLSALGLGEPELYDAEGRPVP
jgi:predicted Zn-dependent peptidase